MLETGSTSSSESHPVEKHRLPRIIQIEILVFIPVTDFRMELKSSLDAEVVLTWPGIQSRINSAIHFRHEAIVSRYVSDVVYPCEQRSEEHTSELQSLMRISYAVFCLKKKNSTTTY